MFKTPQQEAERFGKTMEDMMNAINGSGSLDANLSPIENLKIQLEDLSKAQRLLFADIGISEAQANIERVFTGSILNPSTLDALMESYQRAIASLKLEQNLLKVDKSIASLERQKRLQEQILNLEAKRIQNLKSLHRSALDAIASMATNSKTFSKIIITQTRNLSAGIKIGAVSESIFAGANRVSPIQPLRIQGLGDFRNVQQHRKEILEFFDVNGPGIISGQVQPPRDSVSPSLSSSPQKKSFKRTSNPNEDRTGRAGRLLEEAAHLLIDESRDKNTPQNSGIARLADQGEQG